MLGPFQQCSIVAGGIFIVTDWFNPVSIKNATNQSNQQEGSFTRSSHPLWFKDFSTQLLVKFSFTHLTGMQSIWQHRIHYVIMLMNFGLNTKWSMAQMIESGLDTRHWTAHRHIHTLRHTGLLRVTCTVLACRRKSEPTEETHRNMQRTCNPTHRPPGPHFKIYKWKFRVIIYSA